MYTWPLLIVLPWLWWRQKPTKARMIAVTIVSIAAIALTFAELSTRTRNPLGVVAFDRPGGVSYAANVSISEIVRVTIASAAWTSGQFNDALRPATIALYLGPILIAIIVALRKRDAAEPAAGTPAFLALLAFALAQTYNVVACVLARRGGNPIPIGGKEGWYWYVLVPIVIPGLLVPAMIRWRLVAWWLVAWDVVITEVALFHDFAGTSSPAHGSMLFRWGPLHLPFTAHLGGIGVGPFVASITFIRLIHLAAFFSLESILQETTKVKLRLNDRNTDIAHPN
jgi:undecaprenyl pyrophosphate phosphatase UppP